MGKRKKSDGSDASVISFEEARALGKEHGTPILVCDLNRIKENYKKIESVMPNFDIYYAVKANPLPEIIRLLVKLGSKFDVASKNEISMCLDAGAKPEDLIYANPVKPRKYIKFAYDHNVRTFTFDNHDEVDKMAKYAPGSNVVLRLAVKDIGSVCMFSTKFGAKEDDAVELLRRARAKGLKPTGLAFHVGSQCMNIENYKHALEMCGRIFRKAAQEGIKLTVLDTGGGMPIRYTEEVYPIEEISKVMDEMIPEIFPKGTKLMCEPGRYLAGSCMTLIARVIGVSRRNGCSCIYINDGCYGSLSEKVFGHCEYDILSDKKGTKHKYTVFGPTCDSMDVVTNNAKLPTLVIGDLVMIPNAGAYTNAAATHFNGFDPAKIVFKQ